MCGEKGGFYLRALLLSLPPLPLLAHNHVIGLTAACHTAYSRSGSHTGCLVIFHRDSTLRCPRLPVTSIKQNNHWPHRPLVAATQVKVFRWRSSIEGCAIGTFVHDRVCVPAPTRGTVIGRSDSPAVCCSIYMTTLNCCVVHFLISKWPSPPTPMVRRMGQPMDSLYLITMMPALPQKTLVTLVSARVSAELTLPS